MATKFRDRRTFTSASYLADLMAELDRAAISNRIRLARRQAGFRNRQMLADVMQVHWRTIEDWENPKHQNVPWDRMEELSGVLNVEKMWLLHGEPEAAAAAEELIGIRLESLEGELAKLTGLIEEALGLLRASPRRAARDSGSQRKAG